MSTDFNTLVQLTTISGNPDLNHQIYEKIFDSDIDTTTGIINRIAFAGRQQNEPQRFLTFENYVAAQGMDLIKTDSEMEALLEYGYKLMNGPNADIDNLIFEWFNNLKSTEKHFKIILTEFSTNLHYYLDRFGVNHSEKLRAQLTELGLRDKDSYYMGNELTNRPSS